jgi:hypothetical protein
MQYRKIVLLWMACILGYTMQAQEFNAKVTVISSQIQNVDVKIFKSLEQSLQTFINTRKWTNDVYDAKEKIQATFSLVILKKLDGDDNYSASLSIQSTRPVYNSSYQSSLINYVDKDVAFKFAAFQQLDFNENRVSGNDPMTANLPAVIAYYVNLMLGFDYDSYASKGGTAYFAIAQSIVNNAPEQKEIRGWKPTENQKNRYWIADQMMNNRFVGLRQGLYNYHRLGLDVMSDKPVDGRSSINNVIYLLQQINQENPGSASIQFFFSAKSDELLKFMSGATEQQKTELIPVLSLLDITNSGKYAALLK